MGAGALVCGVDIILPGALKIVDKASPAERRIGQTTQWQLCRERRGPGWGYIVQLAEDDSR